MSDQPWTVVLAAGAGRRLHSITGGVPKQFWRGAGVYLLEQTIYRFEAQSSRAQTVVIVDASHRAYVMAGQAARSAGHLVIQPEDRGTAAGVLLALTPVLEDCPDAIVMVTPSDHGVQDVPAFQAHLSEAVARARAYDEVLLFGVEPSSPLPDYGWIVFDRGVPSRRFNPVRAFVEKPHALDAERLYRDGAVWNTMIVVARASRLAELYAQVLPDLHDLFRGVLFRRGRQREEFLAAIYPTLALHDFSRDVLGRARTLTTRVLPASLGWTDLGTPERLAAWQRKTQKKALTRVHSAA